MQEKETNTLLMDKLAELSELEIKKSKVLATIFQKTTHKLMDRKIQALEIDFEEQAEFYNQKVKNYDDVFQEIKTKYKEQLSEIIDSYHQLFVNLYLELQEAECNQKIAITNLKKSYDTKQEIANKVSTNIMEEYNRKIDACLQKKINYDKIIDECEKELDRYSMNIDKKINALFSERVGHISLKEESLFGKIMNRIKNMFTGKAKFNNYVIEPMNIELEMMDSKLPDIINKIQQETILFVAKTKQAKDDTNKIFDNMI